MSGLIRDNGAKDIAILWSLYVSIVMPDFNLELFFKVID